LPEFSEPERVSIRDPAFVIALRIEDPRPQVNIVGDAAGRDRLIDWINSQPQLAELVQHVRGLEPSLLSEGLTGEPIPE
jgi:hypothetical protein